MFFIIAFATVVAAVVMYVAQRRLNGVGESENRAPQPTFRNISIADGTTAEGFEFSVHHYKAWDCVAVSEQVISFPSDARAENELRKKAATASEVLEHVPEKDVHGNVVGERYVMKFVGSGQAGGYAAIVLSRKSDLISITSTSLTHILEFEKASGRDDRRASFPGLDSVKNVTFRGSGATTGVTTEGVRFAREEFTSSDCEKVTTQTWYFESAEKAQQALERSLKNATGISERGDKVNSAGQRVGMRAVAYFEADPKSAYIEITNILWTDGAELHSIEGGYVYALEFESRGGTASSKLAAPTATHFGRNRETRW
ncbi:MAG: hypothetical protein WAM70_04950 [Pyrinomonadaceae bacterium]